MSPQEGMPSSDERNFLAFSGFLSRLEIGRQRGSELEPGVSDGMNEGVAVGVQGVAGIRRAGCYIWYQSHHQPEVRVALPGG